MGYLSDQLRTERKALPTAMTGLAKGNQIRGIVGCFDLIFTELGERPNMMYSRRISELFFASSTTLGKFDYLVLEPVHAALSTVDHSSASISSRR